jgi:hypothetical protein
VVVLVGVRHVEGAVLFEDDFNDGTYADKWVTYGGNSFDAGGGVFALDSGFGLDDTRAVLKSEFWNPNWREYVVDFDFRIGQTHAGYGEHFALLFNVQAIREGYDRGQYYQFYSFREAAGLIRMESLDARVVTGLGYHPYVTAGRSNLQIDTWYHGRLVVQQDFITGYVGYLDGTYLDTPMFTFDTSGITPEYAYNGPIALKAIGGATNSYDNIRVTAIPEPASVTVWTLIGLTFAGIGRRRRKAA